MVFNSSIRIVEFSVFPLNLVLCSSCVFKHCYKMHIRFPLVYFLMNQPFYGETSLCASSIIFVLKCTLSDILPLQSSYAYCVYVCLFLSVFLELTCVYI